MPPHARLVVLVLLGAGCVATTGSPSQPTTSEAACARPTATAADRAQVRLVIGGQFSPDHLGPDEFEHVRRDLSERPDAWLDALAAETFAADDALLGASFPSNVLDAVWTLRSRRTRALAACLLARYDAALARAASSSDQREQHRASVSRLQAQRLYVSYRAKGPVLCHDEPCASGELCVVPCCVGPCDPAPPHCVSVPTGARSADVCSTLGPGCPSCSVDGGAAVCRCGS